MSNTLKYIEKKFNLDLSQSQPVKIDVIGRNGLAELFSELNFMKGAEVGVDRGAFSEKLCQANPKLHLISIDPWLSSSVNHPLSEKEKVQERYEDHYKDAVRRLSGFNCTIIREESLSAVKNIPDNSLDFVYIDANHNFAHIAGDIYAWEKKVKKGGIISGHDYEHFPPSRDNHVKHVVDAYIKAFEISPYFELGQDRHHSWFWVK